MFSFSSIRKIRQLKKDLSSKSSGAERPRTPSWHCRSHDIDAELGSWQAVSIPELTDQLGGIRAFEDAESGSVYLRSHSAIDLRTPSRSTFPADSEDVECRSIFSSHQGSSNEVSCRDDLGRPGKSRFSRDLPPLPGDSSLLSPIAHSFPSIDNVIVSPRKPSLNIEDAYSATAVEVQEVDSIALMASHSATGGTEVDSPNLRPRTSSAPPLSPLQSPKQIQSRSPLALCPDIPPTPSDFHSTPKVTPGRKVGEMRQTDPPRPTRVLKKSASAVDLSTSTMVPQEVAHASFLDMSSTLAQADAPTSEGQQPPHSAQSSRSQSGRAARSGSFGAESDVDKLARGVQELSAIYSTSTAVRAGPDGAASERRSLAARRVTGLRRLSPAKVDAIAEETDPENGVQESRDQHGLASPPPLRPVLPLRVTKPMITSPISESGDDYGISAPASLTRKRSVSDPPKARFRRQSSTKKPPFGSPVEEVFTDTEVEPLEPAVPEIPVTGEANVTDLVDVTPRAVPFPDVNSLRSQYQAISAPVPTFESIPIAWKGLTLEAAKWAYSSEQMQHVVKQAVRASSETSSIRLLPPDTMDHDISNEAYRLELQRADLKAQYNALIRRRRVLLRSLPLYIDGSDPTTAARLIMQLEECSEACDKLSERLFQVTEQLGQLTEVLLRHEVSAANLGLQKLEKSYRQVRGAKIGLGLELATVEAERNEAWALAEELEQKLNRSREDAGRQEPQPKGSSAWPTATLPLSVAARRQAGFLVRAGRSTKATRGPALSLWSGSKVSLAKSLPEGASEEMSNRGRAGSDPVAANKRSREAIYPFGPSF